MNAVMLSRCSALAFILAAGLAACSGQTTSEVGYTPQITPALASSNFGVRPDACPKSYLACVSVSPPSGANVGLCVENQKIVTSCSGSPASYMWSSVFYTILGGIFHRLNGAFDPNPGDPTLDTVTENTPLKPSGGKYKYYQVVKACTTDVCLTAKIGIATL